MGFNMSAAYWDQWDHTEIMSMYGIEEENDTDLYLYEHDTDLECDEDESE